MPRTLLRVALLALGAIAASADADSITLKRSVELNAGEPVTLRAIADLDGAHATRHADLVLADRPSDLPKTKAGDSFVHAIDTAFVRAQLGDEAGVNWAFLSIRGGTLTVRTETPSLAASLPTLQTGDEPAAEQSLLTVTPEGSIGELARGVVRTILRVDDDALRIVWPDRHTAFLCEPVGERTIHVQPIGNSSRMPLSITIYDGDRIVRTESVRAEITVRRTVCTASRGIHRGNPINADDFTVTTAWVDPGLDPADAPSGHVAARRIEPGMMLETTDITPPLVIERGEQITLHCLSGAVAIRLPARALSDARAGETLLVAMTGSNKKVMARADGVATAILLVRDASTHTTTSTPPTSGDSR